MTPQLEDPRTSRGLFLPAARSNIFDPNVGRVLSVPRCRLYLGTNKNIGAGALVVIPWDTRSYDTDNMTTISGTNAGRWTCQTAGVYMLVAQAFWDVSAAGQRSVQFRKNGSAFNSGVQQMPVTVAGNGTRQKDVYIDSFAKNDYVDTLGYQDSAGALNVLAGSGNSWLTVTFLSSFVV